MRNDHVWPLSIRWVPWIATQIRERHLPVVGLVFDGEERWTDVSLAEAWTESSHATVGQRLSCGCVRTHVTFWEAGQKTGAWMLGRHESDETARAWQVLLLEALVLSSRHPSDVIPLSI